MRHAGLVGLAAVVAAVALLASCTQAPRDGADGAGAAVRVMTFNIRYGTADDGPNRWEVRRPMVFDVIRRQGPDFLGVQEAVPFQVAELRAALPTYHHVGRSREADPLRGEAVPIFYRHGRWDVKASGTFWLSDTPETPGSKSWGNQIPRIVTWGRFAEKTGGREAWVFNVHLDHQSQPAREKGADLLARRIRELTGTATQGAAPSLVVVAGDFNAGEGNPALKALKGEAADAPVRLVDTFRVLHPDATDVGTFGDWAGKTDGDKIDYILVPPAARVLRAEILRDQAGGRYPSDHFPVMADVVP